MHDLAHLAGNHVAARHRHDPRLDIEHGTSADPACAAGLPAAERWPRR